ncbi:hypothetical protein [Macrococcus capreoli]
MKQLKNIRYWVYCFTFAIITSMFLPFPAGPIMGVILAQMMWDE